MGGRGTPPDENGPAGGCLPLPGTRAGEPAQPSQQSRGNMTVRLVVHKPEGRIRPSLPEFVATPTSKKVFTTLGAVHVLGELGAVRGDPGLGKTVALREYARRHARVFLFQVSGYAGGKWQVVDMLCDRFQIVARGSYDKWKRLADRLRESDFEGRSLLIFDEAQNFASASFNALRSLSDEAGVGIVFAGNHDLLGDARRRSAVAAQAEVWSRAMAQVKSRMSGWCELSGAELGDVEAYLEACGIAADREDLVAFLWDFAARRGALRNIDKILRRALLLESGWPFTVDSLQEAVEALHLEMPGRLG